jgi:hypothetical protein
MIAPAENTKPQSNAFSETLNLSTLLSARARIFAAELTEN